VLCTKSWSSNVPECGGFDVRRYSLYPRFSGIRIRVRPPVVPSTTPNRDRFLTSAVSAALNQRSEFPISTSVAIHKQKSRLHEILRVLCVSAVNSGSFVSATVTQRYNSQIWGFMELTPAVLFPAAFERDRPCRRCFRLFPPRPVGPPLNFSPGVHAWDSNPPNKFSGAPSARH
jgi:hypothetical protein